ncbi:MAG: hypothetical protein Q4F76_02050 [Lachnospiraceae bacterium]|nr:hypothetical protein [Lachnospiraceae bacterium]
MKPDYGNGKLKAPVRESGAESTIKAAGGRKRILELYFFILFSAATVLSALWFHHSYTLHRPVFLLMDVEETMFEGSASEESGTEREDNGSKTAGQDKKMLWTQISVYYIQDQEDQSQITAVDFPELEGIGVFQTEGGMKQKEWSLFSSMTGSAFQGQKYGIYEIYGKIQILEENWPENGLHLSRIQVIYKDGTIGEEWIGDLHLKHYMNFGKLQMDSSSSGSDGTRSFSYRVMEDCRLEKITMYSPDQVRSEFDIQINGTDLWEWKPMELKAGSRLQVETLWHGSGNVRETLEPMTAILELHCKELQEEETGDPGKEWIEAVPIQRFLRWRKNGFDQVRKYLKERGAYEAGNESGGLGNFSHKFSY